MSARTRNIMTVAAAVYLVTVGALFDRIPLEWFNVLLALAVVPLVWLIWAFARWSAYQHAERWRRDIAKVHGPSVVARERVRR